MTLHLLACIMVAVVLLVEGVVLVCGYLYGMSRLLRVNKLIELGSDGDDGFVDKMFGCIITLFGHLILGVVGLLIYAIARGLCGKC